MHDVWGPVGQLVYLRTYSRYMPELGRREMWDETVDRVVRYSLSLGDAYPDEGEDLKQAMLQLRGLPAGRTLWVGGTEYVSKRNGHANFNCAYTDVDNLRSFHDMTYLLMAGVGVGFGVQEDNIRTLNKYFPLPVHKPSVEVLPYTWLGYGHPEYHEQTVVRIVDDEATVVVGDSREGWSDAVHLFLELIVSGIPRIRINLNSVRPEGERIRTFGGYASGPSPLVEFFSTVPDILFRAPIGRWTPTKVLDVMNLIGRMIVVGGTRRSAQIALGPANDWDFVHAKTGTWWEHTPWRSQSNNTIVFDSKPSRGDLLDIFSAIVQYGEPGFLNAQSAQRRRPNFRGINPCLAGDTLVPVPGQGLVFIAELADKTVPVVDGNGDVVMAKAEKTGEDQPLLLVRLSDGSEYKVTPWHEFVLVDGSKRQAKDLQPGDELMPPKGVEGAFGPVHDPDRAYVDAWCKDRVPDYVLRGDRATVLAFIGGYLETHGHVEESTVQVVSVHKSFLQQLQALLALLGVHSDITEFRDGGTDGTGGYSTAYRLAVSNPTKLVAMLGWDTPARGGYNVQKKVSVVAVEDTGEHADVFCFGVPTTQSFDLPTCHSGNCAEILLDNHGFCNLSTVVLPRHVRYGQLDVEALEHTLRLLTRHAMRITNVEFPDVLWEWAQVQYRDRLIGISFTGYGDLVNMLGLSISAQRELLSWMRHVVHTEAKHYAKALGIPEPLLKTTVKPEGTLSLLPGVSSGLHEPYAPYYIRRIRINKHDAVAKALYMMGYEPKPETGYPSLDESIVWVYEFPVRTPAKRRAIDVSAVEQLERYKLVMDNYVDHNASITVSFAPEEVPEVVDWVLRNWDSYVAISFLPKDPTVYPLAPYEPIDAQTYEEMRKRTPSLSNLHSYVQAMESAQDGDLLDDPDCATGACPVR